MRGKKDTDSTKCKTGPLLAGSEGGDGWTEAVTGGGRDAAPFNVLLTCYTLFERDSSEQKLDRSFLKKWRWSHMVLVRLCKASPLSRGVPDLAFMHRTCLVWFTAMWCALWRPHRKAEAVLIWRPCTTCALGVVHCQGACDHRQVWELHAGCYG